MTTKPANVDLNKVQQEINNLVERRLEEVGKLNMLAAEKAKVQEKIKACQKEFAAIDKVFKDKLDVLNKYRG